MNPPLIDFAPFPKMSRLSRECVISEKIDGSNAQVVIIPRVDFPGCMSDIKTIAISQDTQHVMLVGSRTRWIRPKVAGEKGGDPDNYGFAAWCKENADELFKLGPGRHFGEWYGSGINRAYGLTNGERRFALFNTSRWAPFCSGCGVKEADGMTAVDCCRVVPMIYRGLFNDTVVNSSLDLLRSAGSVAAPGFMRPEGIVIYHIASGTFFKKTLERDEAPKSPPSLTNLKQLSAGKEAAEENFFRACELS